MVDSRVTGVSHYNNANTAVVLTENVSLLAGITGSRSARATSAYDWQNARNGTRNGNRYANGSWNAGAAAPQWIQFIFAATHNLKQIRVYGLRDNADVDAGNSINDNEDMIANSYRITDFTVSARIAGVWTVVATVTGNTKVLNILDITPVDADGVRVDISAGTCRICELEAWR